MSSLQVITAPAKEWIAALNRLAPVMAGKKVVQILHAIRIDPAAGVLTGFNYETSAVTGLDAVGEGAPFLAKWRWLLDSIRITTSQDKSAMVSVSTTADRVTLRACGYELNSELLPLADYPDLPDFTPTVTTMVKASEFRASLARVRSAASMDDALPILNCVQFNATGGNLSLVATDRYRLAMDHIAGEGAGDVEFLLRSRVAQSWDRHLVGDDIKIAFSNGVMAVTTEHVTFTTMSVDGDYPKIRSLFYKDISGAFEFDRATMLASAKVAAAMTERNTPCFIRMFDGGAEVTFNDSLFGLSKAPLAAGSAVAGCKDETNFALNPRYFVDALQRIATKKVRLSYLSPKKPFTLTPEGVEAGDTEALNFLVMPVRMPTDD